MNLTPYEFERAKDGDLFVKRGDKLVAVSFNELSKDLKTEIEKVGVLEHKYNVVSKHLNQFKKLAKRHFITVFTLFELKALKGEIEVEESLLNLDEEVIADHISVEEAINLHPYLKATFNALYGDYEEFGGK